MRRDARPAALTLDRLGPSEVALLRAVAAAAPRGAEPVLVGGAVRDACLGRRRRPDVDIAVASGAVDLARRVAASLRGSFVVLDDERGAARVVAGDGQLDITDFRASTLAGDLTARDFTVNALGVPIAPLLHGRGPIVDPAGGLNDLRTGRLRPTGPGVLAEDPLRALRAVRLEAALGFRLTSAGARAVATAAPALLTVAPERVRDELMALLALPETARALRRADRLRLLPVIFPEVEAMRVTRQPAPHRFPVLEHSLRAVAGADQVTARPLVLAPFGEELAAHLAEPLGGGIDRAAVLKLAALLHDVAKPETRRLVDGRVRFFGHDIQGAVRTRAVGERLRLPGGVVTVLERLVRHHLRPLHLGAAGPVTPRARYRFYRDLGPETRDLILLALVDAAAVRGERPRAVWRRATLLRDLLAGWEIQRDASATPPLLRGGDVMTHFGLGAGPEVGRLLQRAREAQDLGLVHTRAEALAYLDAVVREPLE